MKKKPLNLLLVPFMLTGCNKITIAPDYQEWSGNDSYTLKVSSGTIVSPDNAYVTCIEKKNATFTILNITDVQLGSEDLYSTGKLQEFRSVLERLVRETKPDLITMTGDQTYSGDLYVLTAICNEIDQYGIPWAPVLGNHDPTECSGDSNLDNYQQGEFYQKYKNCLYKFGPKGLADNVYGEDCSGNYVVNIVERNGKSFRVLRSLVFADSGNNLDYSAEDYAGKLIANSTNYAKLSDRQVDWIKWCSDKVQAYGGGNNVPVSLFLHIPLFAYAKAINAALRTEYDYFTSREDFIAYCHGISDAESYDADIWNDGYKDSFGVFHDTDVCCCPFDDNVFERLTTDHATTLDSVVAGHDHTNDFVIPYQGVILAYGLKTGSGCYYEPGLSGGTEITFSENEKPIFRHVYVNEE